MKKLLLLLTTLFMASTLLFAKPLDFVQNGEYVYYMDERNDTPFFRGFLFSPEGDSTYVLIRSVNLKTNDERKFMIILSLDENNSPNITGMQGEIDQNEYDFFQSIPDIMNFVSFYYSHKDKITYETKAFEDDWGIYVLNYNYGKLYPGFKFLSITMKDNDEYKGYNLNRWGIAKTEDDIQSFFEIKPRDFTPTDRKLSLTIPEKKPLKVTMNKIKVTLDENWKSDNSMGQPGYWLSISSIRDSQIMVEDFSKVFPLDSEEKQCYVAQLSILASQSIKPDTIHAEYGKNGIFVSYDIYDEDNLVSYQTFRHKDGCIINFSTFRDIYDSNPEYYSKILKSIK